MSGAPRTGRAPADAGPRWRRRRRRRRHLLGVCRCLLSRQRPRGESTLSSVNIETTSCSCPEAELAWAAGTCSGTRLQLLHSDGSVRHVWGELLLSAELSWRCAGVGRG
jgi:hypothetical protein